MENPKKKLDAPKFAERLKSLGLRKLFVRVHHGTPILLGPEKLARLIGRLQVGDCKDVELVDFKGNVLDCPKLIADAAALEKGGQGQGWQGQHPVRAAADVREEAEEAKG